MNAPRLPDACCLPPPAGPASPISRDESELAELAKAIAHPARVRILAILSERNACICGDIVDQIPLAQSTVSQHLKQLKDAGLIQGEIDGPRVCYCVNPQQLKRLKVLVAGL
jgi:ArsR family transcriptional regulator, arsenate/arsenite/antimonite-responsive transcriptional repressor